MTNPKLKPGKKSLVSVVGAAAAAILIGVGSQTGFTERFEGMVLNGYKDPIGIPTKCAGDTYDVVLNKAYTLPECKESLERGLVNHAEPVLKCAPYLRDKPYALAASVDHNYHFGTFCNTSINSAFKSGDYAAGCKRFNENAAGKPQWIYVKDKYDKATKTWSYKSLPGLVKRAAARRQLCETGL